MFQGLSNFASLLRQAQQMGGKMKEISENLKSKRATGTAGGGMVEVSVNGLGEVLRVRIDDSLVQRGDREMIEDLVPAATNEALAKAKQLHLDAMRSLTEGMDVRGLEEALAQLTGGSHSEKEPT